MAAIEVLLSFPDWLGILLMSCLPQQLVYQSICYLSHHLIQNNINSDMKDPTGSLFRVIGMLVSCHIPDGSMAVS